VGKLVLDRIDFSQPIQLLAAADAISCRGTRFRAGGNLRVAYAKVTLKDAEVTAPLIVSSIRSVAEELSENLRKDLPALEIFDKRPSPRPTLTSVRRANVEKLTITDLDLRPCRFAGAHHLDQLRLDSPDALHRAPRVVGQGRMVLAEEITWRRERGHRNWDRFSDVEDADPLPAASLARIYRQLRKGREDAKNEPGAADFYYGECEMRRHTAGTPWAERAILTAYWLVSGYGLRATRALLTLLGMMLATVGLLMVYGLPQNAAAQAGALQGRIDSGQTITVQLAQAGNPPLPTSRIADRWSWARFEKAIRIAVNAVVFRSAEQQLTTPGRYIEMAARFLGPVLLALTLLAVRNRVKR
jgi:hypothetical protein